MTATQARNGRNLITWRYLERTQFGEERCTQFRVVAVTDTQTITPTNTHTNPQTGPITIYCTAASLARSVTSSSQDSFYMREERHCTGGLLDTRTANINRRSGTYIAVKWSFIDITLLMPIRCHFNAVEYCQSRVNVIASVSVMHSGKFTHV